MASYDFFVPSMISSSNFLLKNVERTTNVRPLLSAGRITCYQGPRHPNSYLSLLFFFFFFRCGFRTREVRIKPSSIRRNRSRGKSARSPSLGLANGPINFSRFPFHFFSIWFWWSDRKISHLPFSFLERVVDFFFMFKLQNLFFIFRWNYSL